MKKNIKNIGVFALILLGFLLVNGVFAQPVNPPFVPAPSVDSSPISRPEDIISLLRRIFEWFAIIFWLLAVGSIFYAAFKYITAQGEPEKIQTANKMLKYAIIAIALGLVAYGIPRFVENFLRARG